MLFFSIYLNIFLPARLGLPGGVLLNFPTDT